MVIEGAGKFCGPVSFVNVSTSWHGQTLKSGMNSWFKEAQVYRSKAVSLRQKLGKLDESCVQSGVEWLSWSEEKMNEVLRWETVMMRSIFLL